MITHLPPADMIDRNSAMIRVISPTCRRSSASIALVIMLVPAACWGWGKDGHEIVGRIADDRLSARAKQGIRDLVGDLNLVDVKICMWADHIKGPRQETKPWHYVNIPVRKDNGPGKFNPKRDSQDGNNIIDQLTHYI